MYSFLEILLEDVNYSSQSVAPELSIITFILGCIALILCPIFYLIALVMHLTKEKGQPRSKSLSIVMKLGLGSLVAAGIFFLLTATFCTKK